jgi:hypothetical protein
MLAKLRPRSAYDVMAALALFVALSTGGAYAANTVFSTDIVDGEVKQQDLANGAVTGGKLAANSVLTPKLADGAVTSAKLLDDTQPGGGLNTQDLATDSVGFSEVSSNAIDSDEVDDFTLTNQDVGVLFAEVNAVGTLANSSGGVSVTKLGGLGHYIVDFGRSISSSCTAVASIGSAGTFLQTGGELQVRDRSANVEAVQVDTTTSAGAAADRSFRLVVVC